MTANSQSADSSWTIKQFSRFLVVGCTNFAVSFAVFYVLYNYLKLSSLFFGILGPAGENISEFMQEIGADSLDAALANTIGYAAGTLNSFTWNKLWTFKVKHETTGQFARFLVLNIFCLLLSSTSLFLFTDILGWSYKGVWFVTMAIITMINFLVSKHWVFRIQEKQG